MNHSCNDHKPLIFDHFINYAIGKSFWVAPANVLRLMPAAVQQGIDLQGIEYCDEFLNESLS